MSITFTIPGKPCAWQRARSNGKVRFDSPQQARNKNNIAAVAFEAMAGRPPLEEALKVEIEAFFSWPKSVSAKKRAMPRAALCPSLKDADNIAKLIGDALNCIVWADDRQIVDLSVSKRYDETPRTVVTVEVLS